MIEVELPDGRVVEFPDGTPPETMKAALKKLAPAAPKPPTQANIDDIMDPNNPTERLRAAMGRAPDKFLDWLTEMYLSARGEKKAEAGLTANVVEKRRLDKPLMESTSGKVGDFLGEAAMSAVPMTGGMKAANLIFKGARPLTAAVLGSGVGGAAHEAMKPVDEGESRAENALFGFGAGAGGALAGAGVARGIQGVVRKAREAGLLPKSVADKATLGQLADKDTVSGRIVSRLEEGAQNIPGTGSIVANTRRGAANEWRNELVDRVSPTGFKSNKTTGTRDAIAEIQDEFGSRYLKSMQETTVVPSPQFENDIIQIITDPKKGLSPDQQNTIFKMVTDYYDNMFASGQAPGEAAKKFESFLTKQAMSNARATETNPYAENARAVWDEIESAWTNSYRSQLPAASQRALTALDRQYAPFKTVERAATALGNEHGNFTPSQLLSSVKARTARPEFAAGKGLLQREAETGRAIFGDKMPDSGTVERGLSAGSLLAPAKMVYGAATLPTIVPGPGRDALLGDLALQKLLQRMRAPEMARALGGPAAIGLTED